MENGFSAWRRVGNGMSSARSVADELRELPSLGCNDTNEHSHGLVLSLISAHDPRGT